MRLSKSGWFTVIVAYVSVDVNTAMESVIAREAHDIHLCLPKTPSGLKSLMLVRSRCEACRSHVDTILFLPRHSPLLLPNPGGLAVGDSCPTPPDKRLSKVAVWAGSTHGGGPPLVGRAAAPGARLAFCAPHRQAGNGHGLASAGIPLKSYFDYYHGVRTHLSLEKDAPETRPVQPPELGSVVELPEVGGLHHRYVQRLEELFPD